MVKKPKIKTRSLEKFFTWELENFDPSILKKSIKRRFSSGGTSGGIFEGPVVRAFDRYNNAYHVAKFEIKLYDKDDVAEFGINILPNVVSKKCYYFLNRGNGTYKQDNNMYIQKEFLKVLFFVDVEVPAPDPKPVLTMVEKLKPLFNTNPADKIVIKCQDATFEVIKPILAACHPTFLGKLESHMKEFNMNYVQIGDFKPKVVQKMIEFCDTNEIAAFEDLEEELLKIGRIYNIQELMGYAMRQMLLTTTKENRGQRSHTVTKCYDTFEEAQLWWSNL